MNREFFEQRYKLNLSGEVTTTTARGSSYTGYTQMGVMYSGQISDGAKANLRFLSAVEEVKVLPGNSQYIARYRDYYPSDTDVTWTSGEPTSAITNYGTNHKDGVTITPAQQSVRSTILWGAELANLNNLMMDKMDELSTALSYKIEAYISAALAAATEMDVSTLGATLLYAGDKTQSSDLTAADTLDVTLVNEAETRLKDWDAYYWSAVGGTFTLASVKKNPWVNEGTDPFVLIIGPEQERCLRNSSQFINCAEYGGREVLLTGEIGRLDLFGVRVVVSNFVPKKLKNVAAWDATTNTVTNQAMCFLMKGRAAYCFAWGKEPEFVTQKAAELTSDYLVLWTKYAGSVVHGDAIVKLVVATR